MIRILSDIDGVILNFNKEFLKFYNKQYNKKYKEYHIINYEYRCSFGISKLQEQRLFCDFFESKKSMKLSICKEFFKKLKGLNKYELTLITDFPEKYKDKRLYNLYKHNIDYSNIYFNTDRIKICKEYRPNIIFEDNPKYIFKYLSIKEYFDVLYVPLRHWNNHLVYNKDIINCNNIIFY